MRQLLAGLAAVLVAVGLMAACGREARPQSWPPAPLKPGEVCEQVWIESDNRMAWRCWPA